jgi:hypothetical protein
MVTAKISGSAHRVCIALAVLVAPIWILQLATVSSLGGSDAAGNAIGRAYAAIQTAILWVILTAIVVVVAWKSAASKAARTLAVSLTPLSALAAMTSVELLARPDLPPFHWPLLVSVAVPPLVTFWCFMALYADGQRASIGSGVLLGVILAASASMWPLSFIRSAADREELLKQQKYDDDLARLPAKAALWDWTSFLATHDDSRRAKVLDSIRVLGGRQSDAEIMLDRGDFPIGYLGLFDLDPTPTLCEKARNLLRRQVAALAPEGSRTRPYRDIALQVADAVAAMSWLVGYGCPCDAEATAWETVAKGYRGGNFDVYRLAELRDPRELGRTLRERPERFSMLGPASHLKAWLKFADDENLRDKALAGARALDHRTADAVDIFSDKYDDEGRWRLLRYLGALDLEPTTALCANALASLGQAFREVYRPSSNDEPRPYSELLARLGNGEQLPDLIWLAGHGCSADTELDEAITVVSAYQAAPERSSMLATLAKLRSQH